jgi:hypothetical protein
MTLRKIRTRINCFAKSVTESWIGDEMPRRGLKIDKNRYKNDPVYRVAILSEVEKRLNKRLLRIKKQCRRSLRQVILIYSKKVRDASSK